MMAHHYAPTLLFLLSALFRPITLAFAFPPLPSSLYGTVQRNDQNLAEGTLIEAVIDDQVVADCLTLIYKDESVYAIDIPGDDPTTLALEGGVEGDSIRFIVDGQFAQETALWQGGANVQLNLNIKSATEPATPQATPTPLFTQTPIKTNTTPIPTTKNQTKTATQTPIQEEVEPVTFTPDSTDSGSVSNQKSTTIPTSAPTQAEFQFTTAEEDNALSSVTSIPEPFMTAESPDLPQEEPSNRSRTWGSLSLASLSVAGLLWVFWIARRKIKSK